MLLLLHVDRELTSQHRRCRPATATIHRLELGGMHTEPRHLRLVLECTDICRACTKNCQDIGDMDDCVRACERGAESCEQMAAGGGGRQAQQGAEREQIAAR
jgi:hypothetical protein